MPVLVVLDCIKVLAVDYNRAEKEEMRNRRRQNEEKSSKSKLRVREREWILYKKVGGDNEQ